MIPGLQHHRELNGGAPLGWKIKHPNVLQFKPIFGYPPVYAIISTWFDADIIEASVRNCFKLGCSRVYILDNDSPDDSVEVARLAGAEIAEVFKTAFYDDDLRIQKQNRIIHEITEAEALPEIWWMSLDADEFMTTPQPLPAMLGILPPEIRTVGSTAVDLYPAYSNQYKIGKHPAECMPFGVMRRGGFGRYCECGHWKHTLIRYFGVYDVAQCRGNHANALPVESPALKEPPYGYTIFHAPIRNQDCMEARLRALCGGRIPRSAGDDEVTGSNGAIKRFKSLADIYAGRWDRVEYPHSQMYGRRVVGIALYPWRTLVPELAPLFYEQPV